MRDSGSLVANPGWYKALTLKERLLLLRGHPTGGKPEIQDKTVAGKKLQAWRTQAPFDKDVSFEELDHATGSHHIFRIQVANEVFKVARPIKPIYVKQALVAIGQLYQRRKGKTDETNTD